MPPKRTQPEPPPRRATSRRLVRWAAGVAGVVAVCVVAAIIVSRQEKDPASDRPPGVSGQADSQASRPSRRDPSLRPVEWKAVQQPRNARRITTTRAPGAEDDPYRPDGEVMRVELRPGDVTLTGNYRANRAEVYGRSPSPFSTPAERWPDPVGSVRWYGFRVFVPSTFETSREFRWFVFAQWKGLHGGSPPLALELKRERVRLGGTHADLDLGPIARGQWMQLVVGMRLSPDAQSGWVQVVRDGRTVVPRKALATVDTYRTSAGPRPDPLYLKQGIYRASSWTVDHVLYFGPTHVGRRLDDVLHATGN